MSTYQDRTDSQVGWLRSDGRPSRDGRPHYVICLACVTEADGREHGWCPVFAENIGSYRQPCALCARELVRDHWNVILFDGHPRYSIVRGLYGRYWVMDNLWHVAVAPWTGTRCGAELIAARLMLESAS